MTEPTASQLEKDKTSMTLLVHPDTDQQKALWTCRVSREDHQRGAVARARYRYGKDAPLAWLMPDGTKVAVEL